MHTNPVARRTRLAAEIRAEMARQQVTRAALSAATGIKLRAISDSLRSERPFGLDELDTISNTLGMTLSQLVARTDTEAAA